MKIAQTLFVFAFLLLAIPVFAQDENSWEFGLEANFYKLSDRTYLNPVISADKNQFHVEARYNYEDLNTGSLFGGYNLSGGDALEFSVTPIVGAVFGNSDGIAPGFLIDLNYGRFSFSSEGEYFFSSDGKESNFFYSWSELFYSPADWIWFGMAGQRTRAYETDLKIQRGIALGFGKENFAITGYIMNIGWDDVFGVVSVGYSF
ncbi:MAG TPA: hypothetical protein VLH08_11535 [Acidobacteriota bacterium]|nr:hypothetical protein [Acidobacteriota bacterium]